MIFQKWKLVGRKNFSEKESWEEEGTGRSLGRLLATGR
jgi:hypothetical protein